MTQKQLGNLCNCHQTYISNLELYPYLCNLTLDKIYYISKALDIDYIELVIFLATCRLKTLEGK